MNHNKIPDWYDISDNRVVVEALKSSDKAVFEMVYGAYYGSLRAYATAILQDTEAASEIVQDTFMNVWMNRKKLDPGKPLRNYLLRAVHNNALHYRKLAIARKCREEKAAEEQLSVWEEEEQQPLRKEALTSVIARLPEQSRRVLKMSYWEEKKNADIARELSISVRTVETILYKVMKKLRREIKKN